MIPRRLLIPGRFLKDALPGDEVMIRLGAPDERGLQGAIMEVTYREERAVFRAAFYQRKAGKTAVILWRPIVAFAICCL